jgi:hypothetical protein
MACQFDRRDTTTELAEAKGSDLNRQDSLHVS